MNKLTSWLFMGLGLSILIVGLIGLCNGFLDTPTGLLFLVSGNLTIFVALFIQQHINGIDRRFEQLTRLLAIHFKEGREKVNWKQEGF